MKILIKAGRLLDPASQRDEMADVAVASGRITALGQVPADFTPDRVIDAQGQWVLPGLVDLAVRLREPGHEHESMLESEMAAAVQGGVTSLVCLPDTEPALDEPGLVEMLKFRARNLHQANVYPLGALTVGLKGEELTEMAELTEAGCVGFSQAEKAIRDTQVLQRALQYASSFGYTVWLRPLDPWLGKGVAASGPMATRLGLSGVPVAAERIALHTIFELMRSTGARVHLCRISSAAGLDLIREAKAEGLAVTCDVSMHHLHFTDMDIGYYNSALRLNPPVRQQRDRDAIRLALRDGTIDALVSDHNPVSVDEKTRPFAEAEPGATGLELLLCAAIKWGDMDDVQLLRTLDVVTHGPVRVLGSALGTRADSAGALRIGGMADLCLFDPRQAWTVMPAALRSQGKHTPFETLEMQGRVTLTMVGGLVSFEQGH
jgi:dihydroorotase